MKIYLQKRIDDDDDDTHLLEVSLPLLIYKLVKIIMKKLKIFQYLRRFKKCDIKTKFKHCQLLHLNQEQSHRNYTTVSKC
jgi:hypothetical protein